MSTIYQKKITPPSKSDELWQYLNKNKIITDVF